MILAADHGLHIDSHDVLDALPGKPGSVCHLMRSVGGDKSTHHERFVTLGGLDGPTVTWTAICADHCPSLDGNGVWTCTGCPVTDKPGSLADAESHVPSCTGGA
ncbi:hypothetical protein FXF51_02265 [Nonomuraea sp. PA05]|uniref:hypothetical protein n=1 Tax=Nonomuraea sp. PA05 TaxID=2604466 RepID=UPI0011D8AAAC|nr:hypothetical protein [Nonomuraea sp. PA05]TYB71278.1 hypothetical protein FXF51_02265 [Nonomuraea sp. PA05]